MFKNIGKGVNDLLDDDYYYTQKLKIKTTNSSKLSWLTEGEMSLKNVSASMTTVRKGELLSLDKLRMKSDGKILLEASLQAHKALKLSMSVEDGRHESGKPLSSFGKLGCEFKMSPLMATAEVDIVNGPMVRSSMVLKINRQLTVGAEAGCNPHLDEKCQNPEILDVNVGLSYKGPQWNLSVKALDKFATMQILYLHLVSPQLVVGSKLDYRLKGNTQKFIIGSRFK
jgi:voltage-dependent anion channel protein 2